MSAQTGALALDDALRRGVIEAVCQQLDVVERGVSEARPRPELQELPLVVLEDVARLAANAGDPALAARAASACRHWLCGRPAAELDVIDACVRTASSRAAG